MHQTIQPNKASPSYCAARTLDTNQDIFHQILVNCGPLDTSTVALTSSTLRVAITDMSQSMLNDIKADGIQLISQLNSNKSQLSLVLEQSSQCQKIEAAEDATSAVLLRFLAHDPEFQVRRRVAQSQNTPVNTLKKLAADHNIYVRQAVSQNSNTQEETLRELAQSPSISIRGAVARNRNIPADLSQVLAQDAHPSVRKAALSNQQAAFKK